MTAQFDDQREAMAVLCGRCICIHFHREKHISAYFRPMENGG